MKFADPENPSWWVLRAHDDTPLLTWEQERVLSALPGEYATDAVQIKRRTRLSKDQVDAALQHIVSVGLADAVGEFNSAALFRATVNGVNHRQIVGISGLQSHRIYPSTLAGFKRCYRLSTSGARFG